MGVSSNRFQKNDKVLWHEVDNNSQGVPDAWVTVVDEGLYNYRRVGYELEEVREMEKHISVKSWFYNI